MGIILGGPIKEGSIKKLPSHSAGEPPYSHKWLSYFDFTSKKEEKELYLLCGMQKGEGRPILVKVQCVAEVRKDRHDQYIFSCTVLKLKEF